MKNILFSKYLIAIVLVLLTTLSLGSILKLLKVTPSNIDISITIKAERADILKVFYRSKDEPFSEQRTFTKNIESSEDFYVMSIRIPCELPISHLRLDLGHEVNMNRIEIKRIAMSSMASTISFGSKSIERHFIPNRYIEAQENSNSIVYLTRSLDNKYDPYLKSKDLTKVIRRLKQRSHSIKKPYLLSLTLGLLICFYYIFRDSEHHLTELFILVFFALISLPMIGTIVRIGDLESQEQRTLHDAPAISFTEQFPATFTEFYNDNFGFRNLMIAIGSHIKVRIFNSSINPEQAMIGKHKWLYYSKPSIYPSYSHRNLLDADKMNKLFNMWNSRSAMLDSLNIHYLVAFWPNKSTIYPEFMPFNMRVQVLDTISQSDQITNYFNNHRFHFSLIDVRKALKEAKHENRLYLRSDSHWNDYGAFIAYQSLFNQATQKIQISPLPRELFKVDKVVRSSGDLVKLLGIKSSNAFTELVPRFTLLEKNIEVKRHQKKGKHGTYLITTNEKAHDDRKLLVFRDSFTTALVQFISLHFKEVVYVKSRYEHKIVEETMPNIVLDGMVERNFVQGL